MEIVCLLTTLCKIFALLFSYYLSDVKTILTQHVSVCRPFGEYQVRYPNLQRLSSASTGFITLLSFDANVYQLLILRQ